jgi:hypothetical protein
MLISAGDAVLVERGVPRWLVLSCPCGCGAELPINLDARSTKAWRYYYRPDRGVSLFPSVWRDDGCGSHFIIWDDRIILFGNYQVHDEGAARHIEAPTAEEVFEKVPAAGLIEYVRIADDLEAVPWDVVTLCRRLVKEGKLREGRGNLRGHFGRIWV